MSFFGSRTPFSPPSPIRFPDYDYAFDRPQPRPQSQPTTPPPTTLPTRSATTPKIPAVLTPPKANEDQGYFPVYKDRTLIRLSKDLEQNFQTQAALRRAQEARAAATTMGENGEVVVVEGREVKSREYILPRRNWEPVVRNGVVTRRELFVFGELPRRNGTGQRVREEAAPRESIVQGEIDEYSRGLHAQTQRALDQKLENTRGEEEGAELQRCANVQEKGEEEQWEGETEMQSTLHENDQGEPLTMAEFVKLSPLRKVFEDGNTAECRPPLSQLETGLLDES
ncbi:hypothetical protein IAQ61_010271 [Plenodomus lingam]|uniref:Predicted protein n=1 Tax=Leptosphaeria maculans (strain JN3 / isolate v23.1.3 / race Av1-4-5-6-7-8) TaxID=985895 RepID=E5A3G0_LEPMJ|nr:predicted protein [Plenodomus lingam JN3]KAH9862069.1 hypothetical protein IAQ61_010271 [Plenodomus lingam]CBX98173.1 predicted protein [Plenodomus lingam JN3]